jgi:hypothetical protein
LGSGIGCFPQSAETSNLPTRVIAPWKSIA